MLQMFASGAAQAQDSKPQDGLSALSVFLQSTRSGRADFTQVVTLPPRASDSGTRVARTRSSSGSFAFQRPGRFRFVYAAPLPQTIVADGKTLWLYDEDLNQVTVRAQAGALDDTPAALIAGAADLNTLQKSYELANDGAQDGLLWVRATPKARDGQTQQLRVGLRAVTPNQVELGAFEILDSFGQRSLLTFSRMQVNVSLSADTFRFTPPAGADVIRP
ncbi:membrane protein [Hylemonella gracilis str. Niagara R]|uniref:Outer-membrane lipoprotein carrier protein n=2 Tax=Hylemonella gracilis TaxID=80880 RepID=A0A016XF32_9BURK|nr:membrane protein [Hylemonella gracilis str. Niagara R]